MRYQHFTQQNENFHLISQVNLASLIRIIDPYHRLKSFESRKTIFNNDKGYKAKDIKCKIIVHLKFKQNT